jgi:aryl-alcohol dehydrogenase-like predicted oxidoreductase
LRAAVTRSLKRLRVGAADALLLHTIDPDVPVEESVGALADLAEAGLAGQIGVCNVTAQTLARAQDVAPIAIVQNPLNAIDTEHLGLAEDCATAGIAFTAWWPLRGGALARHPHLIQLARPFGLTAAQLALAWFRVAVPDVLPVVGFTQPFELDEALGSCGEIDNGLRAVLEDFAS